ncbi:alpha/beta fold hydrolase [Streptomyces sp. NPDC050523]|uniref:alpha/beta fold hydrolase n=1 Tax=Streptomyces sp. NPDC050523 TaxID=3365622 RepID=UPI0037A54FC7
MHTTAATRVTTDDGARLHTTTAGDPDAPLTVVLCHGYMLDSTAWHFQLPALGDVARLVLYDQRGHGRSTLGSAPVTIERLGKDLHQVLEATAPQGPVILVGHSMGGMVVLALAAAHADLFGSRVTGVALLSTSAGQLNGTPMGLPPTAARLLHQALAAGLPALARLPRTVDTVRRHTGPLAFRLTRPMLYRAPVGSAAARITVHAMSRAPIVTIAACYPALMAHDQFAALPVLGRCPTLVAVGAGDQITPASHSAVLATHISSAELTVVSGASHLLPLERPNEVNSLLLALLSRNAAAREPRTTADPARQDSGTLRPSARKGHPAHPVSMESYAAARPHPYGGRTHGRGPEPDDGIPPPTVASVRLPPTPDSRPPRHPTSRLGRPPHGSQHLRCSRIEPP